MIDNQKRFDFIKGIKVIKGDTQDAVSEQIRLFSQFLAYSNPDYAYNETYLPKYYCKYQKFCEYATKKRAMFTDINNKWDQYIDTWENVTYELCLDQTWERTCSDIVIADPIRFDLICSNQIQVKMLLAEKNGEHMFLKTYKISDEQEKILQDMKDWMEKILDEKRD
ncbi:hypothetical protein DWZ08_13445 [Clostridiaceae bacterium AF29-16BH]|nr:hypothetical protein DWZ08_13445 [Clostridiaceae bacterium AF29-16BH]